MSRNERRADAKAEALETEAFLKVANKFIELANAENNTVNATDLQMAFLYGAARYNAYVAKAILDIDNHEDYVAHMVEQYTEMLRQHLADESLEAPVD